MANLNPLGYWPQWIRYAPLVFLLAVTASLPFNIQINSYLIAIFALSAILQNRWREKWEALKRRKYWLLLFSSLWFIHVIGALYSTHMEEARLQIAHNMALLIFPLTLFSIPVLSLKTLHRILGVFVLSCFIACIYCWSYNLIDLLQKDLALHYFFKWRYSYANLTQAIGAPSNYFSFYIVFALFSTWYLFERWQMPFQKLVSTIIAIVFLVFLFHLSARMSLFALFVTAVIHVVRLMVEHKKWYPIIYVSVFLVAFIIASSTFPLLNNRLKDIIPVNKKNELSMNAVNIERFQRWRAIVPLFYQNPILGVGSGDDKSLIINQYEKYNLKRAEKHHYNAHNQYLQYAIANGVIGLGAFLLTLIIPILISLKKRKWLYVYFIIIFGMCSLTESTMRRNKGIVFYSMFSCVFTTAFLPPQIRSSHKIHEL